MTEIERLRKLIELKDAIIANHEAQINILSKMPIIPRSCFIDPKDLRLKSTFDTSISYQRRKHE